MAASEFERAAQPNNPPPRTLACFERARELLGILETLPLPEAPARRLRPLYLRVRADLLLTPERLSPEEAARFAREAADELNRAFEEMPQAECP